MEKAKFLDPLQKSCDVCFLLGCQHEKDWGHPCDRDEDGYYECELRELMGLMKSAQQSNAAELLPPIVRDVEDDAFVKGTQIP